MVGIEGMENLKELYVQGNEITSLMPLQHLTNLEVLYASGNQLTSFDGITEAHAEKMKSFRVLPNEGIRDKTVIQFQNSIGIICKQG
ncbi:MAG: leucine-rich repeat domain-containing protein [Saprospiraceae bacterium]|nr:leucine-rich repeat domain-containing protein [Saprospiraceae bacterium]